MLRIGSDQDALGRLRLITTKPISQSIDLGGRVVALHQLLHGLRRWQAAAAADQQLLWLLEVTLLTELIDPCQTFSTTIERHDTVTTQLPRTQPMPEREGNNDARENRGNKGTGLKQTLSGKPASPLNAQPRHNPPSAQR